MGLVVGWPGWVLGGLGSAGSQSVWLARLILLCNSTVPIMSEYHKPDSNYLQELKDIANKLRIHSVKATSASNSGSVLNIVLVVCSVSWDASRRPGRVTGRARCCHVLHGFHVLGTICKKKR